LNEWATQVRWAIPVPDQIRPRQSALAKSNLFIISGFSHPVKPVWSVFISSPNNRSLHAVAFRKQTGQASEFPAAALQLSWKSKLPSSFLSCSTSKIKSGHLMELALNLVWLLLAVLLVKHWLSHTARGSARTRTHIAALGMLILILFPVISVTDDLVAAQNPAELDCCVRRLNAASACPHSIFPAVAALPPPALSGLSVGFPSFNAPRPAPAPYKKMPTLASIQNRPPPAA